MTVQTFDCFAADVLEGRKLIESSAGTGKTYTIASLYVRLLVERELQVGKILVVTFTKAATEELKGRIRKNIRETLSVLEGGKSDDEFILAMHASLESGGKTADAAELLRNALRMFDEAAIFTIHGFCGRVLKDNAFESASLFDTELVTDDAELVEEIAADFYRMRIHGELTPFPMRFLADPLGHFAAHGLSVGKMARFIRDNASKPFLSVVPDPAETARACASIGAAEAAFEAAWRDAAGAWLKERDAIMGLVAAMLNRRSYTEKVRARMTGRMDALAAGEPSFPDFEDIDRFRPAVMEEKNNGNPIPSHPFFELFERLYQADVALRKRYTGPILHMRHELLGYANAELESRKRRRNVRFYDDLLQDLLKALSGPGRQALVERVRERYAVGLIDEFQDTDLLQYEIFDAFFPAGATLFLIGDPKQAIYSFRGADVFAYLKAAGNVEGRYSLGENFRSTPEMVGAVNAIFGAVEEPFIFEAIDYPQVTASSLGKAKTLTDRGAVDGAPLKLRFMPRAPGYKPGVPITKDRANREIPEDTASLIVSLLERSADGELLLDGRPAAPGDMAVLVRTNRQARDVHAALRRRGVPAVIYGSESVFRTREAEALQRVLAAVAEPGDDGRLRAALASPWFGLDGAELLRLAGDEPSWTGWVLRFAAWRDEWRDGGFVGMTRSMMRQAGIRTRMLSLPAGERRLTNLLHLFELLHEVEHAERLGIDGLRRWLDRRCAEAGDDEGTRRAVSEEHQLRLETDERAVKVVTIHKAKGLEYPIVFCPYLWDVFIPEGGAAEAGAPGSALESGVLCHDTGGASRMIRDYGSSKFADHAAEEARERLSENARMLYVALTRAKYRCVVTWGALKGAEDSALAKLLHPKGFPDTDEGILAAIDALADDHPTIAREAMVALPFVRHRPGDAGERTFRARPFVGAIDRDWGSASFTALVSGSKDSPERADLDPFATGAASISAAAAAARPVVPTPFDFPKGARSGLFFHALMETIDFGATDEAIRAAVLESLPGHGLGPEWIEPAVAMTRNALSTPLDEADPAFVLSGIPAASRRHEIEFGLPLARLTPGTLADAFAGWPKDGRYEALEPLVRQLSFQPVRGLMKGYIDLLFERGGRYFLLDWKTNHLGGRAEDYGRDRLARSMASSFYFLQSLLYTVALDRYLSGRIPGYDYDTHFGGLFYLYVRGMSPERGAACGVFRDRPDRGLVAALASCLKGGA